MKQYELLSCPAHGDHFEPAAEWLNAHGQAVMVLACGCTLVDGEFLTGLEVASDVEVAA